MSAIAGVAGTPKVEEALRQCDKTGGKKLDLSGAGCWSCLPYRQVRRNTRFLNLAQPTVEATLDFHRLVKLKILFFCETISQLCLWFAANASTLYGIV